MNGQYVWPIVYDSNASGNDLYLEGILLHGEVVIQLCNRELPDDVNKHVNKQAVYH